MAISVARATQHIADWTHAIGRYQSRSAWVSSLFHACQLETAVEIIRQRRIVCRQNVPVVICDVANQGALWNNPAAHQYVRLYFRPRNSFHLKTEGIKSSTDPYRVNPHMSVPIMFVFDFASVMVLPQTFFVSGNFASLAAIAQQGDTNFDLLNFENIYHDSAVTPDNRQVIHEARMAEVVVQAELGLQHLRCVVCRTVQEERMLRHFLAGVNLTGINISVDTSGAFFMKKAMYISELYTKDGVLHFRFTSPVFGAKPTYAVRVSCNGQSLNELQLQPRSWRVAQIVNADPAAIWRIDIEGCTAYLGPAPASEPTVL